MEQLIIKAAKQLNWSVNMSLTKTLQSSTTFKLYTIEVSNSCPEYQGSKLVIKETDSYSQKTGRETTTYTIERGVDKSGNSFKNFERLYNFYSYLRIHMNIEPISENISSKHYKLFNPDIINLPKLTAEVSGTRVFVRTYKGLPILDGDIKREIGKYLNREVISLNKNSKSRRRESGLLYTHTLIF